MIFIFTDFTLITFSNCNNTIASLITTKTMCDVISGAIYGITGIMVYSMHTTYIYRIILDHRLNSKQKKDHRLN